MTPSKRQHAIVFSGNGYNAAYEVGVLKALLQGVAPSTGNEKIQPRIYTGTSVGAFNAAFMVSQSEQSDIAAAEKLEQTLTAGFTPRFRGNPFDYFDPRFYWPNPLVPLANFATDAVWISRDLARRVGGLLASIEPSRPLAALQEHALAYEWDILSDGAAMTRQIRSQIVLDNIRRSDKQLRITAANWKQGKPVTFENRDFTDHAGHQVIAAAMAIPGAVPRQRIDLEEYVDGAMLVKDPLQPAIGARDRSSGDLTLHVIYLDPEFDEGPLMDVRGSFPIVYRLFLLSFSRAVNAHIERVDQTNRAVRFRELLREVDPDSEVMKLWGRLNQDTADAVPVEIHRYRGSKHLASLIDIFRASKERLKYLIECGYSDTLQHDCVKAGCVVPAQD